MHHHHNIFHYLFNRELGELYANVVIRSFALSLISIFVPIYLYNLGFSLKFIALFYIILFGTFLLFNFPAAKLCSKIGIKHTILISIPFTIAGYLLLSLIETVSWVFWVVPILFGICAITFWLGFHVDFASFSSKKVRTKQIGGYAILCSIVSAIGPLLGGIILTFLGFKILFIIGSAVLFISIVPLFLSKEIFPSHNFSFKNLKKQIKTKDAISFLGSGVEHSVYMYIWPIFLFIIIGSLFDIGLIFTLVLFLGIISTFFVSRISDKKGKKGIMKIGASLNAFGWLIRVFFRTVPFVVGITLFHSISFTTMNLPYSAVAYDKTTKRNRLEYLSFRELGLGLGRVLFFALFLIFTSFYLAFVLAALGSLVIPFILNRKKKDKKQNKSKL